MISGTRRFIETVVEMYDQAGGDRSHHPPATVEGQAAAGAGGRACLSGLAAGHGAIRGQPGLLPGDRAGEVRSPENDPDLHGRGGPGV